MATADMSKISDAELDAMTSPSGNADSGTVSQAELDRRYAEGLASPFDPDDDDLDEDMQEPAAEKPGDENGAKKKDAEAEKAKVPEPDDDADEKADEKSEGEKVDDKVEEPAEVDPAIAALHERAKVYKLDPAKFTDPAALEIAVTARDEAYAEIGETILAEEEAAAAAATGDSDAPAKPEAEADPADKTKPEPKKFDNTGKKIEFKLDKLSRDEYAPDLLDAMDELKTEILELRAGRDKTTAELAQERAERANQAKQQQAERQEADARESIRQGDAYFAKKAKESPVWTELFGAQPAAELVKTAEGKKLFENRKKAYGKAQALVAGLLSRKLPTEDHDTSLDTGVRIAFGDKHAEAATKKVVEKVNERRNSGIPRPNSSRSESPRGSALRATMKKHGMSPNADE